MFWQRAKHLRRQPLGNLPRAWVVVRQRLVGFGPAEHAAQVQHAQARRQAGGGGVAQVVEGKANWMQHYL